jgi:hypothetical protein
MLTPDEIRKKATRYWSSGKVLRAVVRGEEEQLFPLRIPWGRPTAKQLRDDFAGIRRRISEIQQQSGPEKMGYTIRFHEINHRRLGKQQIPATLLFERQGFLCCTGKQQAYEQFIADLTLIREREPELEAWLVGHPMDIVKQAGNWPQLLAVIGYFKAHPRPALYLRQLDIAGVDTKFIEQHKKILLSLLDEVLPETAVDRNSTGLVNHGFERRYGLRYDEPLIRLRYLDQAMAPHPACIDMTLPLSGLTKLKPPCTGVIITENKINGLCCPAVPGTVIIFGLGYGIQALAAVDWLRDKAIYYWGDIDSHGFSILSQVRSFLPGTRSFLMDRETLTAHRHLWGAEKEADRCLDQLQHLTSEELALYDELRNNILGKNIRLEQERISYGYLHSTVRQLFSV